MLRKKIIRLSKMLDGKLPERYQINGRSSEYRILSTLLSDRQADVALAAGLGRTRDARSLSRRSGYALPDASRIADELAEIGVFSSWIEGDVRKYRMDAFAPVTMMGILTNKRVLAMHPEVADLFAHYCATADEIAFASPIGGAPSARILPVESKAFAPDSAGRPDGSSARAGASGDADGAKGSGSSFDDPVRVSFHLERARRFCLSDCACAIAREVACEGDGTDEAGLCLHLDRKAEYFIDSGRGREVTRQEALDFIARSDGEGYLHCIVDETENGEALTICSTRRSTCLALRGALERGEYSSLSTGFVAGIDEKACVSCKECVNACPVNAIELSSRFGAIDVKSILAPRLKHEQPDEQPADYRDRFVQCSKNGTAPCLANCRLQMPVQSFLDLTKRGEYEKAYEVMLADNPFPSITSMLCVCKAETSCLRGKIDEPVAIKDVERFLSEKCASDYPLPDCSRLDGGTYDDKIAIIGSGIGGMSCAHYLAKEGYRPVVFEKEDRPGGALSSLVPLYRIRRDVVEREIVRLERMGVEFHCGIEVGKDISIEELRQAGFKAFLIASGKQRIEFPDVSDDGAEGIYDGIEYLRSLNSGNMEPHEGTIVIVGSGILAFSIARSVIRKSGNRVFIFTECRRDQIDMELEELLNTESEGVEICNGWTIAEVISTAGRVSATVFSKVADSQMRPEEGNEDGGDAYGSILDGEDIRTIECSTLIYAGEQRVDWRGLDKQLGVETDPVTELPIVDLRTLETTAPGVFAAGDMAEGEFGAADSIREGHVAAMSIHRFLRKGQSQTIGRKKDEYASAIGDGVNYQSMNCSQAPRLNVQYEKRYVNGRNFTFGKDMYSPEQAMEESSRCMNCANVSFDSEKCIGCAQCALKCPAGAIRMTDKRRRQSFMGSRASGRKRPSLISRIASKASKRPLSGSGAKD